MQQFEISKHLNCDTVLSIMLRNKSKLLFRLLQSKLQCPKCSTMSEDKYFTPPPLKEKEEESSALDTICGQATVDGKSGVAVIRVSGNHAKSALLRMIKPQVLPKPRVATYTKIVNPFTGEQLDTGLALYFPKPQSFTGEDTVELQVHGSRAVTKAVLGSLVRMEHIRLAEPGEFTKRSFFNGKMDLNQVEGLADLLDAETETQRKIAIHQINGSASTLIDDWENRIITLQVDLMADTDFGDTDEINFDLNEFHSKLQEVLHEMEFELGKLDMAKNIKDGIQVLIYGAPNVGKTSVFNLISDSDSIVTNVPGTTRDMVESVTYVAGYKVRFIDSAGVRIKTHDFVEGKGILKTVKALEDGVSKIHVLVCCYRDYIQYRTANASDCISVVAYLKYYLKEMGLSQLHNDTTELTGFFKSPTIVLMNKYELFDGDDKTADAALTRQFVQRFCCKNGYGFGGFYTDLMKILYTHFEPDDGVVCFSTMRHKEYLTKCVSELECIEKVSFDSAITVSALDRVIKHLELLSGKTARERRLDRIFDRFCIGK